MVSHREQLTNEADLLLEAVREVAVAVGPIVADLADARARFLVTEQIKDRDLVPRESVTDQPTAFELLSTVLRRLAEHAQRPQATATGAHDIARRVGVTMGVYRADQQPAFRRTRAQIEADREARWLEAQADVVAPRATRSAAQGRQR